MSHIHVELKRSLIGKDKKHCLDVRGLGLRKIGHKVELKDTPGVRGQIARVQHLVSVVVHEGATCKA